MNKPDFTNWLNYDPYGIDRFTKESILLDAQLKLTLWHLSQCDSYRKILRIQGVQSDRFQTIEDIPYIPVRLFKEFDLLSVPKNNIFKTMTSSGTSGQQVSKIYLYRATASFQTKVLSRLMANMLGKKRVPMLIVDSPSVLKNRENFSARGAGVLGFSMFGQDVTYMLDEKMNIDIGSVTKFLERHPEGPIFIFGFTFMLWQYLVLPMQKKEVKLPLHQGVLLHGGGWKKLQDYAVDNVDFRNALQSCAGINKIVNYYGMVEQTGSLFMECEEGHLHAAVYADIIIRRANDFSVAKIGEEGIIEVLSIIPGSYPGHALLTEDLGVVLGVDDCPCGRLGKYFHVNGRIAEAEARGCSDTYEVVR